MRTTAIGAVHRFTSCKTSLQPCQCMAKLRSSRFSKLAGVAGRLEKASRHMKLANGLSEVGLAGISALKAGEHLNDEEYGQAREAFNVLMGVFGIKTYWYDYRKAAAKAAEGMDQMRRGAEKIATAERAIAKADDPGATAPITNRRKRLREFTKMIDQLGFKVEVDPGKLDPAIRARLWNLFEQRFGSATLLGKSLALSEYRTCETRHTYG